MNNSLPSPQAAAAELLRRREARKTLQGYARYVKGDYQSNRHHQVLCQLLDRFVSGELKRLMIFMPPRHGKSEHVSRLLPSYIFGRNPDAKVIAASYGKDLAVDMNRDVQNIMDSDEYIRLFPGSRLNSTNVRTVSGNPRRNSDLFDIVGHKGNYYGTGIGGAITGKGANYLIIDDAIKNRKEAESEVYRNSIFDWYISTLRTRREKDASILITLTRWHEDDLAGRLLGMAKENPKADQWEVLELPVWYEGVDNPYEYRTEWREPLWADKYPIEDLEATEASMTAYEWSALYMQKPTSRTGNLIKVELIEGSSPTDGVIVEPMNCPAARGWDLGGSNAKKADSTAGVKLKLFDNYVYICHATAGQWSPNDRNNRIQAQISEDQKSERCKSFIEKPIGLAVEVETAITNKLLGLTFQFIPSTAGKTTRADPFAAAVEAGRVRIVRTGNAEKDSWIRPYLNELAAFPFGPHDDMVDGTSLAFSKLTEVSVYDEWFGT